MKIKDKSVLYGITIVHLSKYVHGEKLAKKQYAKAKDLAKKSKRHMKYTDGLPSIPDDLEGILATEDCKILYDLDLLSKVPSIVNLNDSVSLLKKLKSLFRDLF